MYDEGVLISQSALRSTSVNIYVVWFFQVGFEINKLSRYQKFQILRSFQFSILI